MSDNNVPSSHGRLVMKCRILHKAALTYAKSGKNEYQSLLEQYARKKIPVSALNKSAKLLFNCSTDQRRTVANLEIHRSLLRNLATLTTGRPFLRNPLEDDRDVPSPELISARFYLTAWSRQLVDVEKAAVQLLCEALKYYLKDLIQLSRMMEEAKSGCRLSKSSVTLAVAEYPRFFHVKSQ